MFDGRIFAEFIYGSESQIGLFDLEERLQRIEDPIQMCELWEAHVRNFGGEISPFFARMEPSEEEYKALKTQYRSLARQMLAYVRNNPPTVDVMRSSCCLPYERIFTNHFDGAEGESHYDYSYLGGKVPRSYELTGVLLKVLSLMARGVAYKSIDERRLVSHGWDLDCRFPVPQVFDMKTTVDRFPYVRRVCVRFSNKGAWAQAHWNPNRQHQAHPLKHIMDGVMGLDLAQVVYYTGLKRQLEKQPQPSYSA